MMNEMIFGIYISTSLVCAVGASSNSLISTINFNRDNATYSYDLDDTMHFYDKDLKSYRHKNNHVRPQRHGNTRIQYAPLVFVTQEEESLRSNVYNKPTIPTKSKEVSTKKFTIQPHNNKQYSIGNKNENGHALPNPNLIGHNIKLLTKINEIICQGETKRGCGNSLEYLDQSTQANTRKNIQKDFSNDKLSEQNKEVIGNTKIDSYESQNIFERFHKNHKPIKHIIQVLPALESAKIQPILNPYYVKGSRVHMNMARALKIAHGQNKAPLNGRRKRIRINKLKHFVPDIDELLEKKKFLSPSHNNV